VSVYLATFLFLGYATRVVYVSAFVAACTATAFTNLVLDRGEWRIGLLVPPRFALRDFVIGAWLGVSSIVVIDFLIGLPHISGRGFPSRELFLVYVPAAMHEEIVFRGYLFQKTRAWHRGFAIASSALLFGSLHVMNGGITMVAVANLVIAGVMLALAYEMYERLWLPIGIHLAWNVMSGPILGYGVSGYSTEASVFVTVPRGATWLSGGSFGIEGSVWATVVELIVVAFLLWRQKRRLV